MNIIGLFPTPVGRFFLERSLTEIELNEIEDIKGFVRANYGNYTSIDSQVLNRIAFVDLKSFLQNSIDSYIHKVYDPKLTIKSEITLSWINFTEKGGHHHKHSHPNSFLSGVFYMSTDSNEDKIYFHIHKSKTIDIEPKEYNLFNADTWWLPATNLSLYIFPSELFHSVTPTTSNSTRISLSFNVFIRGEIGSLADLKWIKL